MKQKRHVYTAEERSIIKEYMGNGYGYKALYKKFVTVRINGKKLLTLGGAQRFNQKHQGRKHQTEGGSRAEEKRARQRTYWRSSRMRSNGPKQLEVFDYRVANEVRAYARGGRADRNEGSELTVIHKGEGAALECEA